jgi:hypothetical protein
MFQPIDVLMVFVLMNLKDQKLFDGCFIGEFCLQFSILLPFLIFLFFKFLGPPEILPEAYCTFIYVCG